jgi:hypothetical protein
MRLIGVVSCIYCVFSDHQQPRLYNAEWYDYWINLIFIGPCIVIYSYSTTNKMHLLSQTIYSCKTLNTRFGRSFRLSPGAQNCVYSNGMCQTAAATCCYWGWDGMQFLDEFQLIQDTSRQQPGWILPDTVNTVKCSWWWAKTPPKTCRADEEK